MSIVSPRRFGFRNKHLFRRIPIFSLNRNRVVFLKRKGLTINWTELTFTFEQNDDDWPTNHLFGIYRRKGAGAESFIKIFANYTDNLTFIGHLRRNSSLCYWHNYYFHHLIYRPPSAGCWFSKHGILDLYMVNCSFTADRYSLLWFLTCSKAHWLYRIL